MEFRATYSEHMKPEYTFKSYTLKKIEDGVPLRPGDITADPGGTLGGEPTYWHHTVVEQVEENGGEWEVTVINLNGDSPKTSEASSALFNGIATVRRDPKPLEDVYLVHYDETVHCDDVDVVLERARGRLNERGYNPFTYNCEHFARWCKTGVQQCDQVFYALFYLFSCLFSGLGHGVTAVAAKQIIKAIVANGAKLGKQGVELATELGKGIAREAGEAAVEGTAKVLSGVSKAATPTVREALEAAGGLGFGIGVLVGVLIELAFAGYELIFKICKTYQGEERKKEIWKLVWKTLGSCGGNVLGGFLGAFIGGLIPLPGTAIAGGIIGSLIGAFIGKGLFSKIVGYFIS